MTTMNIIQPATAGYRLPDPPPRDLDEATAFRYIYKPGSHQRLAQYFGNPETTLVEYDLWIVASPEANRAESRRPDMLVAFNVSAEMYAEHNGYIISEQGKPPDFVMEVASPSTAGNDTGVKRNEYAALGIPEYWRFDSTGEHYNQRLAGEVLDDDTYRPLPVEEIAPGILQGYSPSLGLLIRWKHGQLDWWDPQAEAPIPSWDEDRKGRFRAEARNRELEEEIQHLRQQLADTGNGEPSS